MQCQVFVFCAEWFEGRRQDEDWRVWFGLPAMMFWRRDVGNRSWFHDVFMILVMVVVLPAVRFLTCYSTYLAICRKTLYKCTSIARGRHFGRNERPDCLVFLGKDPQLAESVAVMKKHVSEEALRTCKRVVIIGETGAGKSAFCGLLEGSLQFCRWQLDINFQAWAWRQLGNQRAEAACSTMAC